MEQPVEGQAQETPSPEEQAEEEWASVEVEVAGKRMTRGDVIKSYAASEARMREGDNERTQLRAELEGMKWAGDLQNLYNQNPEFKTHMDSWFDESGNAKTQQNIPTHESQRIAALEQRHVELENERSFDKIRQQGYDLDKDMEQKVLHEMAVNPNVREVEATYWKLFGAEIARRKAEQAVSNTADHLAQNRDSYTPPAKGAPKPKSGKDPKDMTPAEFDEAVMKRLQNQGDF